MAAEKLHTQFSDDEGNIFYLENGTEDVMDSSGKPLSDGGDLSEASVQFTADSTRKLPQSGGRFKTFLGSIVKYLSDLKTVAFSGKYSDLSEKPSIPSGAAASQAVANNCTTTAAGSVLDARQGKVLMDKANQLSSETDRIRVYVGSDGKLHFVNKAGADSVLPFRGGGIAYIACVSSGGSYPNNTEYVIDKDTTVKILTTNDYMHVFLNNEEVHLTEIGTKDVTGHIGSWYAEISATKGDIVKISTSTGGGVAYSISY